LIWGTVAFAIAIGVSLFLIGSGAGSPLLLLVFCAACAIGGVVARDHLLTKAARDREQRMLAEFPTIADLHSQWRPVKGRSAHSSESPG
jgi:tight adherence protein C